MKRILSTGFVFLAAALLSSRAAADSIFPFYDNLSTEQGSFFAVRPFYSRTTLGEGEIQDFFWPLYSRKEFKDEKSSRALVLWWTHTFPSEQQAERDRNWFLPFYFQGTDKNGGNYFALFPLGGTIHEFLGRDEISFALFPMYGRSQINDVKTTSVLWPVYSHTRGEGIARDRVFPVFGKSVLEGKYEKKFFCWPLWTSAEYFYPGDSGNAWILFPLFGRADLENEKTLWLVPPFFRFTDGEKQDKLYCPWPFIQRTKGNDLYKLYVWPLWGEKQFDGGLKHRTFLFWPVFWSEKSTEADLVRTRRMAVPFFFMEHDYCQAPETPKAERTEVSSYWKIWPLMSWQQDETAARFRMLELWPLKNTAPIERNWAPLWTLYKRTNLDGTVRKDVLWFTWHSEDNPQEEIKEWSLLKGLLAYKKQGDARSVRVLYFLRLGESE